MKGDRVNLAGIKADKTYLVKNLYSGRDKIVSGYEMWSHLDGLDRYGFDFEIYEWDEVD